MHLKIKKVFYVFGVSLLVLGVVAGIGSVVFAGHGMYVSRQITILDEMDGGLSTMGRLSFFLYAMVCVGGLNAFSLCWASLYRIKQTSKESSGT